MYKAVLAMHRKFGFPAPMTPHVLSHKEKRDRVGMMMEELTEYVQAENLEDEVDAIVDLIVFALGTGVMHGVNLDAVFNEVMRANMDKVPVHTDRATDDLRKPDGWRPPDVRWAWENNEVPLSEDVP